jgi:hypothetical protein
VPRPRTRTAEVGDKPILNPVGDLAATGQNDVFALQTLAYTGPMTFRLQTAVEEARAVLERIRRKAPEYLDRNVSASVDQLGRRTTHSYDALNRETQVQDALDTSA